MDNRCHRGLVGPLQSFCPMAVMRLKAMRNSGRELTEEEENRLPGGPWAINDQLSNYCFFSFIADHAPEKTITDPEMAAFLGISQDTVKKVEKAALIKMRQHETFEEIVETYDGDTIMEESGIEGWPQSSSD